MDEAKEDWKEAKIDLKTKRHYEIIEKIDRECLNDTGLRVLREIEVKTTIAKRDVLLLERMLEKTIFQKEDDVKVSQKKSPRKWTGLLTPWGRLALASISIRSTR